MEAVSGEQLARACARHFGTEVVIDGLHRLSGGASRETWSFDVTRSDGAVDALVLRRDPGADVGGTDRSTEFELLRAAAAGGVAVPETRFLLEEGDGLGAGFVMTRIEGETIPRKLLRDPEYAPARAVIVRQCAEAAAAIHAIPVRSLPHLPHQDASALVAQFRGVVDALGEPHPAFELGLRWLADRAPGLPPTEPALVHGDLRNGNLMVGPEGLRAVLDWELAHVGDPVEDLGWFCVRSWRFGNVDRRAGGFGSAEELLAAYAVASGRTVAPAHLDFWEVFGTLKWGVICEMQTFSHLQQLVRSVELAALGRRVAENEWDLVELIDRDGETSTGDAEPAGVAGGSDAAVFHSMHDRPTASELAEAVREYLERDVVPIGSRVGFHGRVAARILAMIERELLLGPAQHDAELARLRDLTGRDGTVRDLQAALAAGIRAGEYDDRASDVLRAVRASVRGEARGRQSRLPRTRSLKGSPCVSPRGTSTR